MYSGNLPIDENNPSRQLFLVFQTSIGEKADEVTIWLNGGPGCSSLEGFFQENGRFLWQPGLISPIENQYSWVNEINMLWVEFPIELGFTLGSPTANSEEEISLDFIKFYKNFQILFGTRNFKTYLTGES
jgi:carboxypeptidase D